MIICIAVLLTVLTRSLLEFWKMFVYISRNLYAKFGIDLWRISREICNESRQILTRRGRKKIDRLFTIFTETYCAYFDIFSCRRLKNFNLADITQLWISLTLITKRVHPNSYWSFVFSSNSRYSTIKQRYRILRAPKLIIKNRSTEQGLVPKYNFVETIHAASLFPLQACQHFAWNVCK